MKKINREYIGKYFCRKWRSGENGRYKNVDYFHIHDINYKQNLKQRGSYYIQCAYTAISLTIDITHVEITRWEIIQDVYDASEERGWNIAQHINRKYRTTENIWKRVWNKYIKWIGTKLKV